jgi:hypothetical protein
MLPLLLTFSCGSTEQRHDLNSLEITTVSLTAGFDVEKADTAQVFASMAYSRVGDDCPALPIDADLDGTPLTISPNGTGKIGAKCQLGFYIELPTSDGATRSTVSFRDATGEASFTVDSLLVPHALVAAVEPDATLQAGNRLVFGWTVDSDKLQLADAYFKQAPTSIKGDAKLDGNNVQVTLPELTPGSWTVRLGGFADGSVTACMHAAECTATIAGNGTLAFKIE